MTLFVAVPVLAIGLWRAGHGSASWGAAALGALGFVAYTYAIFVFSVATNPMSLAHYAVLGLASWAILLTLLDRASQQGDPAPQLPRQVTGWYLVTVAILFAALWLQAIIGSIVSGRPAPELEALGLPANPVWALDLAFALPVVALTGIWLLRDDRRGAQAAFAVLVFAAVMGTSILAIFAFDALAGAAVALPPVVFVALVVAIAVALVIGARAAGSRPAGAIVGQSESG